MQSSEHEPSVALDGAGRVFISDPGNHRIQVFGDETAAARSTWGRGRRHIAHQRRQFGGLAKATDFSGHFSFKTAAFDRSTTPPSLQANGLAEDGAESSGVC